MCLELDKSSGQEKGDIGDGREGWQQWKSADELDTFGSFFTDDLQYSGDGYAHDISMSFTSQEFIIELNRLIDNGFWSNQVSMITVTFNAYEPNIDRFIVVQQQYEVAITGDINHALLKVIVFSLDQIKQTASDAMFIDIIQFGFCLLYFYRAIVLKIIKADEMKDKEGKLPPGYSPCCSISTDLLVVLFFIAKFVMSQYTNYFPIDDILMNRHEQEVDGEMVLVNEERYIDMVRYADLYLQ